MGMTQNVKVRKSQGGKFKVVVGLTLIIIGIVSTIVPICLGVLPNNQIASLVIGTILAGTISEGAKLIHSGMVQGDQHVTITYSPEVDINKLELSMSEKRGE